MGYKEALIYNNGRGGGKKAEDQTQDLRVPGGRPVIKVRILVRKTQDPDMEWKYLGGAPKDFGSLHSSEHLRALEGGPPFPVRS